MTETDIQNARANVARLMKRAQADEPITGDDALWLSNFAAEAVRLMDQQPVLDTAGEGVLDQNGQLIAAGTELVSEAGLYRMLMSTNSEPCIEFQSWLAQEVLPEIRKAGRYELDKTRPLPRVVTQAFEALRTPPA